jgi:3',5'-nucleoside bisphosphate phosphatase
MIKAAMKRMKYNLHQGFNRILFGFYAFMENNISVSGFAGLAESGRAIDAVGVDSVGCFSEFHRESISKAMMCLYDGQVHTTASDGVRTPRELALEVYRRNMTVAVTDHYRLDGAIESVEELYQIKKLMGGNDSEIISGIEFSAKLCGCDLFGIKKIHVLGVGVDTKSRHLRRWVDGFNDTRAEDIRFALEIKQQLETKGFVFDSRTDLRLEVFRNVYKALARSIYIDRNTSVVKRFFDIDLNERRGRFKSKRKRRLRIERKIIGSLRGKYGDFSANKPSLEDAVEVIKKSGGIVVLPHIIASHPKTAYLPTDKLIELFRRFRSLGFDGVEAYHPCHRIEVADRISNAASKAGLFVTGGSDSHTREQKIGVLGYCD